MGIGVGRVQSDRNGEYPANTLKRIPGVSAIRIMPFGSCEATFSLPACLRISIDLVKTQSYHGCMKKITTHYAKTHLSRLLKDVQQGEEIIILNGQTPAGRLIAVAPNSSVRPAVGTVTSKPVACAKDAFAPLSDADLGDWGL